MTKIYCHNCGRDYDGKDGQRVCVHTSIGGTDAIHAIEEKQRAIEEAAKKATTIATPDKESKSKTEGDRTPS